MKFVQAAAILVSTLAVSAAHADAAFDACVRKLCTSTSQDLCTIKAGAAICDRDQIGCSTLPDFTPAKVLRKEGRRWEVQTTAGKGWVSDRMMMISGNCYPG